MTARGDTIEWYCSRSTLTDNMREENNLFNNFKKEMEDNNQGGGSYQERKMYPATCADCKKETEVPFEPSGDRPVYCLDCFKRMKAQER